MVSPEGWSVAEPVVEGAALVIDGGCGGGRGNRFKEGNFQFEMGGWKFAGADKIFLPNEISGPSSKKYRPPGG